MIGFEQVRGYPAGGVYKLLPANTPVSPAVSLAARLLAGPGSALEFLPPKVSVWKQFARRHSSRKLVLAGGAAGLVALVVGLAFAVQQWQLAHWRSQWSAIDHLVIAEAVRRVAYMIDHDRRGGRLSLHRSAGGRLYCMGE